MQRFFIPGWLVIFIVCVSIGIMGLFMFIPPFRTGPDSDPQLFSQYGSFIAGVVGTILSILNALLIYNAFISQRRQFADSFTQLNNQIAGQRSNFERERFEALYFEMVRTNRQIVVDMSYETPDDYIADESAHGNSPNVSSYVHVTGQKVFVKIQLHFEQAMKETNDILELCWRNSLYFKNPETEATERRILDTYLGEPVGNDLFKRAAFINVIYLSIFFGLSESGQAILRAELEKCYHQELIDKIILRLRAKPVTWSTYWKKYEEAIKSNFTDFDTSYFTEGNFTKYYGGHQHRLGHYFRQLFALINFVNDETNLLITERERYVKSIRAQLSTYEQSIFFLNSVSFLGRIWELSAERNSSTRDVHNKRLISKYDLVKNIPAYFIKETHVKWFYPFVTYELDQPNARKTELKKNYV